jgi:hypothetical protein
VHVAVQRDLVSCCGDFRCELSSISIECAVPAPLSSFPTNRWGPPHAQRTDLRGHRAGCSRLLWSVRTLKDSKDSGVDGAPSLIGAKGPKGSDCSASHLDA